MFTPTELRNFNEVINRTEPYAVQYTWFISEGLKKEPNFFNLHIKNLTFPYIEVFKNVVTNITDLINTDTTHIICAFMFGKTKKGYTKLYLVHRISLTSEQQQFIAFNLNATLTVVSDTVYSVELRGN